MIDLVYIYVQTWLLCFLAFLFGPMVPALFLYGFIGLLINDIIVRVRIAYTVRRFPKYDDNLNQMSLIGLSYSIFFYLISAFALYSNEQIFANQVNANKSASSYNSASSRDLWEFRLDPSLIFLLTLLVLCAL